MSILNRLFPDRGAQEDEVRKAYHLLFNSVHGQKVLAHMLAELHFFDEISTEEERILSNYAKRLLSNVGAWQGMNVPEVVKALLRMPFIPPDNE